MNDYYDLTFFSGPSHGWLRVPYTLLVDLGIQNDISSYSYIDSARMVYLEEDRDAPLFHDAIRPFNQSNKCIIRIYEECLNSEDIIRRNSIYKPVPVREFSVRLTLDIETTGVHISDLWDQYERDPVKWIESLIKGDWTVESLDIDDDGPAEA